MPPLSVTFDTVIVREMLLTRKPGAPTVLHASWKVVESGGRAQLARSRDLPLTAGQQTTFNNLWNAVVAAIEAAEGI